MILTFILGVCNSFILTTVCVHATNYILIILSLGTNSTNNSEHAKVKGTSASAVHPGMVVVDNQTLISSSNSVQPTTVTTRSVNAHHHHHIPASSPSQPLVYLTPEQWLKYSAALSLENGGNKHWSSLPSSPGSNSKTCM